MRIVESPLLGWKHDGNKYTTEEGYQITSSNMQDVCKFAGVPATLVNVDNKYGIDTAIQVIHRAQPELMPKLVLDDDGKVLSVLNPKSDFITDEQFDGITSIFHSIGMDAKEETRAYGAMKRVIYTINNTDEEQSKFMGDVFKKQIILERLQSGGMVATLGILRQICTNGAVGTDKQFKKVFHKLTVGEDFVKAFAADILAFSLPEYLMSLWTKEGKHIQASVADFLGMKETLRQVTDSDTADIIFPTETIENHYNAQAIDVMALPRMQQQKLPSGVTYYDAFNFLTNGVKANENRTMEDDIKVSDWARPSRLLQLKKSDITFSGAPYFSPETIHLLSGDKVQ